MNVLTIHRKFWKPLLLLALLVSGEGKTWGVEANANHPSLSSASVYAVSDDEFLPYEGIACKNGDFETNAAGEKRQHCFVWKYDYYVAPGTDVELKAPIMRGMRLNIPPIGAGMTTRLLRAVTVFIRTPLMVTNWEKSITMPKDVLKDCSIMAQEYKKSITVSWPAWYIAFPTRKTGRAM